MNSIIVDSNILLDILTDDKKWAARSGAMLEALIEDYSLVINPIIYAEVSIGFKKIETLEDALPHEYFERKNIPWEAAFLAGKCFLKYRKRGGEKKLPLPDFFIGAHAAIENMGLATRDISRFKTYFPNVKLFTP